jgi:CheY-like chemotaxis protein
MLFDLRGRGRRRTMQSDIAMSIVSGVSLKLAAEHPPPVWGEDSADPAGRSSDRFLAKHGLMRDDRFVFASRTVSALHYDDVPDMRALVRYALADDERIRLLAGASTADEPPEQVLEFSPDVVVLDLAMPDRDGLELIPELQSTTPTTAIVVFSAFPTTRMGRVSEELGAGAYVEKGANLQELREAIVNAPTTGKP